MKGNNLKELKVGIIGVGHIGTLILKNIMHYGFQIYLATNKPDRLIEYTCKTIIKVATVCQTNNQVVEACNVVFFCIPPTLDGWIVSELRGSFEVNKPFIISTISDCNQMKLRQLTNLTYDIFCRP